MFNSIKKTENAKKKDKRQQQSFLRIVVATYFRDFIK